MIEMKTVMTKTVTMTTPVEPFRDSQEGQLIFLVSVLTSDRNVLTCSTADMLDPNHRADPR